MTFRERLEKFTKEHKDVTIATLCKGLGIDVKALHGYVKLGAVPSQEEMRKMAASAKSAKLDICVGDTESAP